MEKHRMFRNFFLAFEWTSLKEVWQYRELFFFLVWRDIKIRYKQTVLGVLWAIIQPLSTMLVFTIFFGRLANLPNDGIPYPIFYYSALLPWIYFSTSISLSGNSLISNTDLVTKVYFPRVIIPAASVLAGVVDYVIGSTILILMIWLYPETGFSFAILLWPVLLAPLVLFAISVGMILSALNVSFRDIKYTIPFIIQLWLFLSPVIYPASMVEERLGENFRFLFDLNPVVGIIEAFRVTVIPGRSIDWGAFLISITVISIVFVLATLFFHKAERRFADLI
ncbi:MAG: ABC transporter permease [Gammaproteobacteria bacterium]